MGRSLQLVMTLSDDVASSLARQGVVEARLAAVESPAGIVREPAARFDVTAQRMRSTAHIPDESVLESLRPWVRSQLSTELTSPDTVLGVLSARDELTAAVWAHRTTGALIQPPLAGWDIEEQEWLDAHFELTSSPSVGESLEHLREIVSRLPDGAVLAVFNVTTFEPGAVLHRFTDAEYMVRAHRLDLMLERAAEELGFAVIDIDRIIAEFGGANALGSDGMFTEAAADTVAQEALDSIDQLGIDGLSLTGDVMTVNIPAYDRRTNVGHIETWRVAPGNRVERGTPLFDLRFDNIIHRVDAAAKKTNRSLQLTVVAAEEGTIASIDADPGAQVTVGEPVGVVVAHDSIVAPPLRDLGEGLPPFRVGVTVRQAPG